MSRECRTNILTTAVDSLPRERRDRLNAIAGEILDDAHDIGTPDESRPRRNYGIEACTVARLVESTTLSATPTSVR